MFKSYTKIILAILLLIAFSLITQCSNYNTAESSNKTFTFKYSLDVNNIPEDASELQILIPYPIESSIQHILSDSISTVYEIITEPEYGNKLISITISENIPINFNVYAKFLIKRFENNALSKAPTLVESPSDRFLKPDSLVPVAGVIADEASKVVSNDMTNLEKAKALYDHIFETMKYDKSGTGWGRGDALYACDVRSGNCTDIHSAFIGMARSQNIPTRFIMGFPLPSDLSEGIIKGYHCWAEFYIDDKGWVPVDISEAIKHPDKKEYLFGQVDCNRVSFSIGRDIKVETSYGVQNLNYLIYPMVFVDGEPFDDFEKSFFYEEVK